MRSTSESRIGASPVTRKDEDVTRKRYVIALAAIAGLGVSAPVFADRPGDDWISISKALSIVEQHGYSQVSEIEADDGHWEGEGMKNGKPHEFHVDPHSGKITKDRVDE